MYPTSYIIQYAKKKLSLEHTKNGTAPPEIEWIGHLGIKHGMTMIIRSSSSLMGVGVLKNIFKINIRTTLK